MERRKSCCTGWKISGRGLNWDKYDNPDCHSGNSNLEFCE